MAAEDPFALASRVDELINANLKASGAVAAPLCADEDFVRRVFFDISGSSPSIEAVTHFGLDPDPRKRARLVDRMLASAQYAESWARYWRDVIYSRATENRARISQRTFETWMTAQLEANRSWADIATSLLTATGDVTQAGETALIFSQQADPAEVAAETARVFLGIQIQCANCHDHPTDRWKRADFHGLAAFFPRMQVRPVNQQTMMRSFELVSFNGGGRGGRGGMAMMQEDPERLIRFLDRNDDQKLSRQELRRGNAGANLGGRLFELADSNKDGLLTAEELKKVPPLPMRPGRGAAEYYMPDLNNPGAAGTPFDPSFFLADARPGAGLGDLERRRALAGYITSKENSWFAKAFVNRLWGQLVGEGFYMPIDDIGPDRQARHPEALDLLASAFAGTNYDIKWLFRVITATQAYQRQIRSREPQEGAAAFASANPNRLRADQLYDALTRVLGVSDLGGPAERFRAQGVPRIADFSARGQFNLLFGFDPSTSPDEVLGTLPQALFLMNSPVVNGLIRAQGNSRLASLLRKFPKNDDALEELYLIVHSRRPSAKELETCRAYIAQVGNRQEAFEDLLWSLINSTEFQSKR
jgi:hypothetical protein